MNRVCTEMYELISSVTGAEPSEPGLFYGQNLHRYVRIQGLTNSELKNSVTGAGAVGAGAFFMNRVRTYMYELIGSVMGAEPSEPELFHEQSCMNTICTNTRAFE
jgi:hypothetical protein